MKLDPPAGLAMLGYGNRVGRNTGVHDDLAAQALVLSDGANKVAIAGVDVLAVGDSHRRRYSRTRRRKDRHPRRFDPRLRDAHAFGARLQHLRDSARRREAGRGPQPRMGARAAREDRLRDRSSERKSGASDAPRGSIPIQARNQSTPDAPAPANPTAANRAGPADAEVSALGAYRANGTPIAFLMNYPCHGVVLCEDNLLYSRDWPGFAMDEIETAAAAAGRPRPISIFIQGATGNIDPRSRGNFEVAEHHGRAMGRAAFDALRHAPSIADAELPPADSLHSQPKRYQRRPLSRARLR